ncbi:hypothetical protein WDV85_09635 [Pseudokineococcus sp. 5B2Z-1]|uniref:hypothetical protein n=1 Tax=Pseudokineococcus sp. 5B2Z-1 TaxID=3132744 RepID=UPI003097BD2D
MTERARAAVAALVVVVGLGGCGTLPGGGPPSVVVRGERDAVALAPWTWCWTNGCVDGLPPQDPTDLGSGEQLLVGFPADGWDFEAVLRPAGQPCGPAQTVPLERTATGEHRLLPAGPAGSYDVDLLGRGPQGDVVVTVRWTTEADGPLQSPVASLGVLSQDDGTVDSYGVELLLDDLAATPGRAEADITVTSSEGRSTTLEPTRLVGECDEEGRVDFTGPAEQGQRAAALGTAPLTYDVALLLDGRRHTATATWPDDARAEDGAVALVFTPALPALTYEP